MKLEEFKRINIAFPNEVTMIDCQFVFKGLGYFRDIDNAWYYIDNVIDTAFNVWKRAEEGIYL